MAFPLCHPRFDYSNIVWHKFLQIGDKRPVVWLNICYPTHIITYCSHHVPHSLTSVFILYFIMYFYFVPILSTHHNNGVRQNVNVTRYVNKDTGKREWRLVQT